MTDRITLAEEITAFLEKHSKIAADYDPEYDEPGDRFNGPDSAMLFAAAEALKADREFQRPHSDWGSGCYAPLSDESARATHDDLVRKVNAYLEEHYPRSGPRI